VNRFTARRARASDDGVVERFDTISRQKMTARARAHSDSDYARRSIAKITGVGRRGTAYRSARLMPVAISLALAFTGTVVSPAFALLRTGVVLPGTTVLIQTDPCLPQPQVTSFTADSLNVALGQTTTLQWTVQVPDGCPYRVYLEGPGVVQTVGLEGTMQVSPLANTVYAVQVYFGPGLATSPLELTPSNSATVSVGVALPPLVEIKGNTGEWKALLVQALGTPGTAVRLARDVDMDLSGFENIAVAHGVSLTSDHELEPLALASSVVSTTGDLTQSIGALTTETQSTASTSVAARLSPTLEGARPTASWRGGLELGPRLYTTSRPRALFSIGCDSNDLNPVNVHFSGFRIQGPHQESEDGDDNLEQGIHVTSCVGDVKNA